MVCLGLLGRDQVAGCYPRTHGVRRREEATVGPCLVFHFQMLTSPNFSSESELSHNP